MYSRLLCMIIKPNKFLTISFSLAGGSQGLKAILMGAKVMRRAALTAHSTGLHLLLKLWVRNMEFVSASPMEISQIPNFPPHFGSSQALGVWVHTELGLWGWAERLGLAAGRGVKLGAHGMIIQGAWLAKYKMRFCGHFAPRFILISHQQLIICEQCSVCLGYLEYLCYSSKINRRWILRAKWAS